MLLRRPQRLGVQLRPSRPGTSLCSLQWPRISESSQKRATVGQFFALPIAAVGVSVTIPRLLLAEQETPHGGEVTYLAETSDDVVAERWEGNWIRRLFDRATRQADIAE